MMIRGSQYFRRYQTTTHFMCEHEHDKGPSMAIALELSTVSEITHVHIAHLNIPITRLSVHETDDNAYYLVSSNWFYDFIKLSQPIILLHSRRCNTHTYASHIWSWILSITKAETYIAQTI